MIGKIEKKDVPTGQIVTKRVYECTDCMRQFDEQWRATEHLLKSHVEPAIPSSPRAGHHEPYRFFDSEELIESFCQITEQKADWTHPGWYGIVEDDDWIDEGSVLEIWTHVDEIRASALEEIERLKKELNETELLPSFHED